MKQVLDFLHHNGWAAVLFWLAVTGIVSKLLQQKSADAWVAWAEKSPRLAGMVQILRGLGLDVPKVLEGLMLLVLGVAQRQVVARIGVVTSKDEAGLPPGPGANGVDAVDTLRPPPPSNLGPGDG